MEGLRVPPNLENVSSINFVLTQEPGKLKPKDLKVAIERNRAERELRAAEQDKLREEGGGAGMLDLRGILAEERLNSSEGDPFKRQLREMAFLADVDDVDKLEIEKGFRVSEDYVGSALLSSKDVSVVFRQRRLALLHKKRSEWRHLQGRDQTALFSPTHPLVKAGAAAETARVLLSTAQPHFDANRNDVWAKRLNTLRRFVALVSQWLIRRRVQERMGKVLKLFHENGCFTREQVRAFVELAPSKQMEKKAAPTAGQTHAQESKSALDDFDDTPAPPADPQRPASVSSMVFALPNQALQARERNAAIIAAAADKVQRGESEITPEMARRVLFPRCNPTHGGGGDRELLPISDTSKLVQFDDRTFFQLKSKPEYITLGYGPEPLPPAPVYLPPCRGRALRLGAPEEKALRPPADAGAKEGAPETAAWLPAEETAPEPALLRRLIEGEKEVVSAVEMEVAEQSAEELAAAATMAIVGAMPSWLAQGEDTWPQSELDFLRPSPELRTYGPDGPRRSELDADWPLRPDSEQLLYQADPSLRSEWGSSAGFLSANIYLLGNQESRNRDAPPAPGPTLSDYYLPDGDRHRSGLGCFARDHLRGDLEWDADVAPLQSKQDKRDYLTDSESDSEEGYANLKPSLHRARKLLQPPPPKEEPVVPAGKSKKGEPAPVPVTIAVEEDDSFVLGEEQRKEEQVELLRDRKTLDLESTILRARKAKLDLFAQKMCEVSAHSRCLLQALPLQMPFHSYEEEVQLLQDARMPPLSAQHVESGLGSSMDSMNLSPTMSPMKG